MPSREGHRTQIQVIFARYLELGLVVAFHRHLIHDGISGPERGHG